MTMPSSKVGTAEQARSGGIRPVAVARPTPSGDPWGYILLVFGAGLLAFVATLSIDPPREVFPLVIVLALVIVAERFPVPLYYNGQLSVSFTGVIFVALTSGLGGGVLAGACVTIGCTHPGRQPLSRPLFNFGQHVLAAAAACLVVWALDTSPEATHPLMVALAGAGAGLLMYATSAVLVSRVISLASGRFFRQVFRENFGWLLPHYVGLGFIAGGAAATYAAIGWAGVLICLIPLVLAGLAAQQVLGRTRSSMRSLETANAALASAHNEIQVLLEAIPDTILRIDGQQLIAQSHLMDDRPIGGAPVEAGRHMREVLPASVAAEVEAAMRAPEASGQSRAIEYTTSEQGQIRHYEARVIPLAASHPEGDQRLLMVRDITRSREASEARRVAEELRQSVTGNTPVVLFATDAEGTLSLIEGQGLGALAGAETPLVGMPVWSVFPGEARMRARVGRVMTGEAFREVEETGRAIFDAYYAPLHDERGEVSGMVGIALNITERRRVEEAMQQAQKLESLGVLAGGIAHDFNNLLVGILGNAGLALEDTPPDSPAYETLGQIRVAGERAAELARQMLAYSGRGRFNVQPTDLEELVHETAGLLGASISKRIGIQFETATGECIVDADATQLRQIVMNLVLNAADAIGDSEGSIRIATSVVEVDEAMLAQARLTSGSGPGEYIMLSVADTGTGMDEATIERIFDPFFTTKFTGRGLGLAALLGIIKAHGGAIFVESTPGLGTTFRVIFPRSSARSGLPTPPAVTGQPEEWRDSGTILIVDDDATVTMVTARALERYGFTTISASDGESGLAAFRERSEELVCVLLDMTMPRMNGLETFEAIHAINPRVPVLMMSGFAEEDVTDQFAGKAIAGFVQKPYELSTLIESVRRVAMREPSLPVATQP